jgi:hypothetical protein
MFYVCEDCIPEPGPGRYQGMSEDDYPLAVALEALASGSFEDHFLSSDCEYAGQFGQHILYTDSQGFVTVETFSDSDQARLEMDRLEDNGMGADEDDAYIGYSHGRLEVSFDGKHIGTFTRLGRAKACVSLEMRKSGYFPNVWLTGEHGPTIRRIEVW